MTERETLTTHSAKGVRRKETKLVYQMYLDGDAQDPVTESWLDMLLICDLLEGRGQFDEHSHLGVPEEGDLMCGLCLAESKAIEVRDRLSDLCGWRVDEKEQVNP